MKKVYAFLADGFEIVECMAVVDVLRRGGLDVVTVSITDDVKVTSSHKVIVLADTVLKDIDASDADCLFLPGGMPGTTNLMACKALAEILKKASEETVISAICAAPSVLGQLGLLVGKTCTSFPGFEDKLIEADYRVCGVVKDGNVVTGRGMGVAVDMGLALLEVLADEETAAKIKAAIQHPDTLPENKIFC